MLPLPLAHSWPLFEEGRHFDLGFDFAWPGGDLIASRPDADTLADWGVGVWDCDLADETLSWSAGVFDLFGLPRDARPSRPERVALYDEGSRAQMERLRAYAIKHRRGFTLDAAILPGLWGRRRMRLVAMPVCESDRVVRLRGVKIAL